MTIWIMSRDGKLSEGLGVLLTTLPGVTSVETFRRIDAVPLGRSLAAPDAVIVGEETLGRRPAPTLAWVKRCYPRAQCVVLARATSHMEAYERAGADEVWIKGWTPQRLMRRVQAWTRTEGESDDRG